MTFVEVFPQDCIRLNPLPDGTLSTTIRIKNLSQSKLAFKIKSNTREKYEVSPAQGVILAESPATVEIIIRKPVLYLFLQIPPKTFCFFKENLNVDQDKFMISIVKMNEFPEVE